MQICDMCHERSKGSGLSNVYSATGGREDVERVCKACEVAISRVRSDCKDAQQRVWELLWGGQLLKLIKERRKTPGGEGQ